MCFTLKIYFIGLIAFVASPDQREMHVLLVDARQEGTFSDGSRAPAHQPLLVAKADWCCGQCREEGQQIANMLFKSEGDAARKLRGLTRVIHKGGAWRLNDSILSIQVDDGGSGLQLYTSPQSRSQLQAQDTPDFEQAGDFRWVARMGDIVPAAAEVNPDVLVHTPKDGLITARLTLNAGVIKTYTLADFQGEILEIGFQTLDQSAQGRGPQSPHFYANWVVAEIPVAGEQATILERNFLTGARREMTLSPAKCGNGQTVELAIVNLPEEDFVESDRILKKEETHGKHFELYYGLAKNPPGPKMRPIPVFASRSIDWSSVYSGEQAYSRFLELMGLRWGPPGRGNAGRPICIVAQFSSP